jgi:hypothetical protein
VTRRYQRLPRTLRVQTPTPSRRHATTLSNGSTCYILGRATHIQPRCRARGPGSSLGVNIPANHPNYSIWQVVAKVSIMGKTHPEPLMEPDFMACQAPSHRRPPLRHVIDRHSFPDASIRLPWIPPHRTFACKLAGSRWVRTSATVWLRLGTGLESVHGTSEHCRDKREKLHGYKYR